MTANLFTNAICIGEKVVNDEDCFVLKLEANPSTLEARSSSNVEIIRHTVWGYFSQRTGLLVQLEDSHLLRIKTSKSDSIFWETTMESLIQDYQTIDGVNIAHSGKTSVSLFRYGENSENHSRTRMEEIWTIEEVDFNIKGLSMDCFLPPSDLKKEDDGFTAVVPNSIKPTTTKTQNAAKAANTKMSTAKVAAVDDHHTENLDGSERM